MARKGGYAADNLMTVAEMAAADRAAIAAGVTLDTLMIRAGHGVAAAVAARYPGLSPRSVLVLCGPGHNGGDGVIAARFLAEAGWTVAVAAPVNVDLGHPDRPEPARWTGPVLGLEGVGLDQGAGFPRFGLVIDALYGAGLNRPLDPAVRDCLGRVGAMGVPIVAVDVPSGIMGDTGADLGAVAADLTVTFERKKPGHVLLPGRTVCGAVIVVPIGLPATAVATQCAENTEAAWIDDWPRSGVETHKFQRGHALLIGGYPLTGAGRLAARASARIGAGLVTVLAPPDAMLFYALSQASLMVEPLIDEGAIDRHLADRRVTALLIGPGAGITPATRRRVAQFLAAGRPTVLDADALSVFAGAPDELARLVRYPTIITPHEGEFKRLLPAITGDRLCRARRAAVLLGAVVILKGPDTVIAAPDGRALINANAPPTLATAGAGDVLAGFCLGLLAQGMPAFEAAAAAVWVHGAVATACGVGLIADDLPEAVPAVLHAIRHGGCRSDILVQKEDEHG